MSERRNRLTKLYEEHIEVIRTCVYSFAQKHGGDIDEMLCQASLSFIQAYDDYDETKNATFPTWVRRKIRFALLEMIRDRTNRKELQTKHYIADAGRIKDVLSNIEKLCLQLPPDAKIVVSVLLKPNDELLEELELYDGSQRYQKDVLRDYLRMEFQWDSKRIRTAFKNISEALEG